MPCIDWLFIDYFGHYSVSDRFFSGYQMPVPKDVLIYNQNHEAAIAQTKKQNNDLNPNTKMIYTALTRQPYGSLLIHTLWSTICSSWVFFNREAHRSLHVQFKTLCLKFQFQLLEEACWTHFGRGQKQDMPTDATAGVGRK